MGSLDGRVALITGAGRGIGREEALFFAAEGAKVVVNDPGVAIDGRGGDASVADAVVDEIVAAGGTAVANIDSAADWRGAERIVETALDAFGDLHIVVNNAAISRPRALVNMTEDEFDDVIAVKLKGTFAVSRWAARYWREQYESGPRADRVIVNTSSTSGLDSPYPLNTNYAAANAGVGAMTIVHSLELGRYNVRVNCLSPGARTRTSRDLPAGLKSLTGDTPDHATYDPWHPVHQAVVAAYLAGAGCPLTGQILTVRGSAVTANRNWSLGEQVSKENAGWTVEELAHALEGLTFEDRFDKLAYIRQAYGATDREQLQLLLNTILDNDEGSAPTRSATSH
ncbi:SDR family NAD(P)-dependent oxidoreductase [Nonomuraea sp. KC401]|uniref:SDR family NAD(P)-dependent oxidoreductase n=1 Tax=unclassified Nonomuraea TaxID=2593643 RepID=UPI0010FEC900|nr:MULTISPECIES: SDR family NAD(P)-dependent oxidoreductase [unclassified Nonomuraea]NBE92350.1 SDR family NAD(P)-dependent oxidoreductase [Nonomuraea sp. K271]TLF81848.1 SDR family NAD(P)-dependent oxidoreductase [Nonomuraea sp. KC401]